MLTCPVLEMFPEWAEFHEQDEDGEYQGSMTPRAGSSILYCAWPVCYTLILIYLA